MKLPLIAASLVLVAGASQAYVLDFGNGPSEPSICSDTANGLGATVACSNYGRLLQGYGDVAGVVDVSYSVPRLGDDRSLYWWGSNYNDLYGVLFADGGDSNSRARIELMPLNGDAVTLTHFDLGAYPSSTRGTTVHVYEIGSSIPLFTYVGDVGSGSTTHTSFDISVSSSKGLWLEWQDSAWNVGIDNVTFAVSAVPEPSTYALLLAGLATCGAMVRRRRG